MKSILLSLPILTRPGFARLRTSGFRPLLAVTACLLSLGTAVRVAGADSAAEAEIRSIHQQYDAAWVKQDAAAFERLLAPGFEAVESDGQVNSRESVIRTARDGSLKFNTGESRDVRIIVNEGTAVVRGLWRGRGVFKEANFDELMRYTTTYTKVGAQWKALSDQVTKFSAAAAVARLHEKYTQAHGEQDAAAVAALFTKDAWEIAANQPIIKGRTAIEEDTRGYFKWLHEQKNRMELSNLEVQEFGDWAYNLGRYKTFNSDGTVLDEGTFVGVWKLEDGEWKLHRDIGNSSLPKKDK